MFEKNNTPAKVDLKNFTLDELIEYVEGLGEPSFRAKQIFFWLYQNNINSFEQMTNISKKFRSKLSEIAEISQLKLDAKEVSKDGSVKYAFKLSDGKRIESVLIPDEGRNTLCVSSQVGCAMGCSFCLTGTMGFVRNLTRSEIVNQVYHAMNELSSKGDEKVNNLVFMGMGEPLANFENLIGSIRILTTQTGMNFSDRKITVSTCGIVPKIIELGQKTKVNLAISLHAASSDIRNNIMPVNNKYSLSDVLDACRNFPMPKRKRIMIEYVLLKGINDSKNDARKLVKILHEIPCKINLLPFNECSALPYECPSREIIDNFQQILLDAGMTVIVRESRGSDISAACGQLANKS